MELRRLLCNSLFHTNLSSLSHIHAKNMRPASSSQGNSPSAEAAVRCGLHSARYSDERTPNTITVQRNTYIAIENVGSDPVRRLNSLQFAACMWASRSVFITVRASFLARSSGGKLISRQILAHFIAAYSHIVRSNGNLLVRRDKDKRTVESSGGFLAQYPDVRSELVKTCAS